jgi:methyl-accepting chemotaxis protein
LFAEQGKARKAYGVVVRKAFDPERRVTVNRPWPSMATVAGAASGLLRPDRRNGGAAVAAHERGRAQAKERMASMRLQMIVAALLAVALAVGVALPSPLHHPADPAGHCLAESVASGNATAKVTVHGQDEVGRLMYALQSMVEGLHRIVTRCAVAPSRSPWPRVKSLSQPDLSARTEQQASSLEETGPPWKS